MTCPTLHDPSNSTVGFDTQPYKIWWALPTRPRWQSRSPGQALTSTTKRTSWNKYHDNMPKWKLVLWFYNLQNDKQLFETSITITCSAEMETPSHLVIFKKDFLKSTISKTMDQSPSPSYSQHKIPLSLRFESEFHLVFNGPSNFQTGLGGGWATTGINCIMAWIKEILVIHHYR